MKITKVELYYVSIPLKNNFYPSWIPGYPQSHNRFDLLKLTTSDGYEGFAAGTAFGEERRGLGDLLAPYILGNDPTDLELAHQRLTEGSILGWRNFWMEAAFYDIKAKSEDIPVWKMLGGEDKPIPVYWSTGEVCKPDRHSKIIDQAQEEGYNAVKLRVHSKTLEEDIAGIKRIRELVDDEFPLAIDANQGWPVTIIDQIPDWNLERAKSFIEAVENLNIWWLEEPLEMHMYEELAELREESTIKIGGAELNKGWHEARMMLHFGSFDIYQPDVVFFGFRDALKVLEHVKKDPDLHYSPHTWTNGVGMLTNMQMYALTDYSHPLEFPYEPGSWTPEYRDMMLKEPIIPEDGYLQLPQSPGLGLDLSWDIIERYGTKYFEMTEGGLSKKVIKDKGLWTALKLKYRKWREPR